MARPPTGPYLVDRLAGSDHAKHRARVILGTIAGTLTIDEAATALECNRAYLHKLRDQLLDGMIAAAEPRKPGPRPQALVPSLSKSDAITSALAEANRRASDAEVMLELERCRAELALVLGPRIKKKR
jgi:hypothetical protein